MPSRPHSRPGFSSLRRGVSAWLKRKAGDPQWKERLDSFKSWRLVRKAPPRLRPLLLALLILLCLPIGYQIAAYAAFTQIKHAFEDSWWVSQLMHAGWSQSHGMMAAPPPHELASKAYPHKVILVDISKLARVDADGNPGGTFLPSVPYTSRAGLLQILDRIAACKPKAIGFDIDLSPEAAMPKGQMDLIDRCLELRAKEKIGVFLGVHRTALGAPQEWLKGADFSPLAAAISVLSDIPIRPPVFSLAPLEIYREGEARLPSMSLALAAWAKPEVRAGTRAGFPLTRIKAYAGASDPRLKVTAYSLDYSQRAIVDLWNHTRLSAQDLLAPQPPDYIRSMLEGSIVLVGEADPELTADKHIVPHHRELIPGIYLHAIGVQSLLHPKLWRIHPLAEFLLGLGVVMSAGLVVRRLHRHSTCNHLRQELQEIAAELLCIAAVAWALSAIWSILWYAWLACAFGSVCEAAVKLYLFPPHATASDHDHAPAHH